MKRILSGLLFLLPLACCAQSSKNINTVFDNAIRNDTELKVVRTTIFPQSERSPKASKTLTYSKELKLWIDDIKDILDDSSHSEADKITFIKNALADTSRDVFEFVTERSILFWRSSKEATQLIEQYFASKALEHSNEPHVKYKHFEFIITNLYPQAYDSIIQYFNKRETLILKYPYEGRLVHALIQLGKEKEALHYMEILIKDFLNGKIDHIALGIIEYSAFKGIVFEHLCFSNNPEIVAKATDLLFQFLEAYDYKTFTLYPLTAYLDKARHQKLLSKKFARFATIHPSQLESKGFFSFMCDNSLLLGEVKGREMWKKFFETMPYCNRSFETNQMQILENAFRDTSLSQQEMRSMLMQRKKTEQFFNDYDMYGKYKARFLRLICKAYPNKKVPKEDFEKLQLNKILKYTSPLQITSNDLKVVPVNNKLTPSLADSLVNDLNAFAKDVKLNGIVLTNKERYFLSLDYVENTVFNFFANNNRMISFDAESASVPANYIQLFETEFEPALRKSGITNIEISQTTTKINKDLFHYKIYAKCGDVIFMHEHQQGVTDWHHQQRLSKLLNLCLIQSKSVLRLVDVDNGDQVVKVILFEPRKLKPLLIKYRMAHWAINDENDEFYYVPH